MTTKYDLPGLTDIAWCTGCGNFSIHLAIKKTLDDMNISPTQVVISSGIGQAAKMPQYIQTSFFNGLHGRALPTATGIKASNPELIVIAEGGDGDMYGEGGNHFMHTVRRNPDIVHLVHNNQVYGLTKGQPSPTSPRGFKTNLQPNGVKNEPANPLALALSYGATFVARVYSGDREILQQILEAAINHKGYALIDIFHPCVTFNKINTHKWYKENSFYLDEKHDVEDFEKSLLLTFKTDKFPLGIIYKKTGKPTFDEQLEAYQNNTIPLFKRPVDIEKLQLYYEKF